MRQKYYQLITKNSLVDVLKDLDVIPYSMKFNLLTELLNKFNPIIINRALIDYETNYIKAGRFQLIALKHTIQFLCKMEQESGEKL